MSLLNPKNYRNSTIGDGWMYREYGTTIIGVHPILGMKQQMFPNYKSCHTEFKRLTGKKMGRPNDRLRHITNKGDII